MGCRPESHSAESVPIGLRPCLGHGALGTTFVASWEPPGAPVGTPEASRPCRCSGRKGPVIWWFGNCHLVCTKPVWVLETLEEAQS